MNTLFALTATLMVLQGNDFYTHEIDSSQCDGFLRAAEWQIPDADVICVVTSPRPIARPAGLVREGVQ